MKRTRWLKCGISLLLAAVLLTACAGHSGLMLPTSITLRILTEQTESDGMESQIRELMAQFETQHQNVNLIIDVLPADKQARSKMLSQIYVDIHKGTGPDIYLLPSGHKAIYGHYDPNEPEPLFDDVMRFIHMGYFADISSYYKADADLDKESLSTAIMDAGMIGGARYVLPLRYNIPVVFAETAVLKEYGLDTAMDNGIDDFLDVILATEDPALAREVNLPHLHGELFFNLFPPALDYEKRTACLPAGNMIRYLQLYWAAEQLSGDEEDLRTTPHIGAYISMDEFFTQRGYSMMLSSLDHALDAAAIAKAQGISLEILPVRAIDGSLVADITYYGAVGADCAYPEVAYDFLSSFLHRDAQWETARPQSSRSFTPGLIGYGWPVRAAGSVGPLWRNLQFQASFYLGEDGSGWEDRAAVVAEVSLTDSDISALSARIDTAQFHNPAEDSWGGYVAAGGTPTVDGYSAKDYAGIITSDLQSYMESIKEDFVQ